MRGEGGKKSEDSRQAPTRKTKAAVDRCQNNKMLRQCPSSIVQQLLYHAVAVPTAARNSHKDNVCSSASGKQLKQKKSNSQAQLHLPALHLFWANLWVQQHLPPLDFACPAKASNFFLRVQLTSLLLILPGLLCGSVCVQALCRIYIL